MITPRYFVIAAVVARSTGRVVWLAFGAALGAFKVPGEVLTDIQDGKQFTYSSARGRAWRLPLGLAQP